MPFAERDGTRLYWEEAGSGDPVLLIMGLGMNATGWWRTIPVLAEHHRVLAFDNRGVGRSDRPPGPYSVPMLADDAVAILDAAGEQSANVYGISLGGMIAQEVVLRHAGRVRRLVLGATTAGGNLGVPAGEATLAFFRRRGEMPARRARGPPSPTTTARERAASTVSGSPRTSHSGCAIRSSPRPTWPSSRRR
jgi:pimeloyl-ACP methyl ester carboxylesterase